MKKPDDLLKELEQKWSASADERIDLVNYTNLLLQNAKEIKTRKRSCLFVILGLALVDRVNPGEDTDRYVLECFSHTFYTFPSLE